MIELNSVSLTLGERQILRDINLSLSEHRIAIIGANGSGKSSLARLLNGLHLPSAGNVLVDGLDTAKEGRAIRRKVGFVFQNPDNQIVFPTVSEDIGFGLSNLKLTKQEIAERTDKVLNRYGLNDHRDAPAHTLSGGQKQLLAIAGVLAMDPSVIVFDEPTTLLDLRNKRKVVKAIHDLEQQAILVTHDLDLLDGFDRVIVIEDGQVAFDAAPAEAIAAYKRLML